MAIASDGVTATAIDATEFAELARAYRVSGVPKIVINDRVELLGAYPEPQFLEAVLGGATPPAGAQEAPLRLPHPHARVRAAFPPPAPRAVAPARPHARAAPVTRAPSRAGR